MNPVTQAQVCLDFGQRFILTISLGDHLRFTYLRLLVNL